MFSLDSFFKGITNIIFGPLFALLKSVFCWILDIVIRSAAFFLEFLFILIPEGEVNTSFLNTLDASEEMLMALNWVFPLYLGIPIAYLFLYLLLAFMVIIPAGKVLVHITP